MLIIALVLAAIGLAALVFAVVTSNALVAWVCIGASLLGVLLLIVDALRERRRLGIGPAAEPVVVESPEISDDDAVETAEVVAEADAVDQARLDDLEVPDDVADSDDAVLDETSEEPAAQHAD